MLTINPGKPSFARGQDFVATVKFDAKAPVACRKFTANLVCVEKSNLQSLKLKDKEEVHVEKLYDLEQALAGDCKLAPGNYYVSIKIPANAPPSDYEFGKDGKIRVWTLYVKLDVPMAPDEQAQQEIKVQGIEDE
ncbi:MAG: hypothetical protein WCT52_01280 [Candidatus Micrarchaeia archaeon]